MRNKVLSLIVTIIFTFLSAGIGMVVGYKKGEATAYEKIISGECWLDEQTRDIECTEYIGK